MCLTGGDLDGHRDLTIYRWYSSARLQCHVLRAGRLIDRVPAVLKGHVTGIHGIGIIFAPAQSQGSDGRSVTQSSLVGSGSGVGRQMRHVFFTENTVVDVNISNASKALSTLATTVADFGDYSLRKRRL